jgi:dihydroorotase
MEEFGLPLLHHGEDPDPAINNFDKEEAYLKNFMAELTSRHPNLLQVFEHCTTQAAVEFVREHKNVYGTITPQHLLLSLEMLGINDFQKASELLKTNFPHLACQPIIKTQSDRQALLAAAFVNNSGKFFAGTDSAPHPQDLKEQAEIKQRPAGCFSAAPYLLYREAFYEAQKKAAPAKISEQDFDNFTIYYGAKFYNLKLPEKIDLNLFDMTETVLSLRKIHEQFIL